MHEKNAYVTLFLVLIILALTPFAIKAKDDVVVRAKFQKNTFSLFNSSEETQQCRVRVGHDYLWAVLSPKQTLATFHLSPKYYLRHVSVQCTVLPKNSNQASGVRYKIGRYQNKQPARERAIRYEQG